MPLFCLVLTFALAVGARFLETPFWDNPAYSLGGEFLLATHDAYHWIAGAEGFEFGAGHPMSELARLAALITGASPAVAGFWLPPLLCGFTAVAVFLWCWGLGRPFAGLCAGVLASLAPAFCARTLLGFYDTDLVVLLFAVLLGLVPALWLSPRLCSWPELLLPGLCAGLRQRLNSNCEALAPDLCGPDYDGGHDHDTSRSEARSRAHIKTRREALAAPWLVLLVFSGLFGHWMQDWHSLFPYLARFSLFLLPLLIVLLGPRGGRTALLAGGLCHALPLLLGGWAGLGLGLAWAALLLITRGRGQGAEHGRVHEPQAATAGTLRQRLEHFAYNSWFLGLAWLLVLALAVDIAVFEAMRSSFSSYADRSGDLAAHAENEAGALVFPSVAQSIIEVQTISFRDLLIYVYPHEAVTAAALLCFFLLLLAVPATAWLAPLFVLSLLSLRMGARMTLFGPAALLPALCMVAGWLLERAAAALYAARLQRVRRKALEGADPEARVAAWLRRAKRAHIPFCLALCLVCTLALAWPLARLLPDYTQGPVISREHAEGLAWLRDFSEADSLVWDWWDWGYAAHHFARRHTIADGARHGGPSLFLPAAVYTTADPRFARQIIKYTARKGNVPGQVFAGLNAAGAQQLMRDLGDRKKPLIKAEGRQYLVVSLELLRLGLWVTRYGSWNFETRQASGSLMNNLTPALEFNVETGAIRAEGTEPVYASDIVLFSEKGLARHTFNRYGAYHFLFNTQHGGKREEAAHGLLRDFWTRQRGQGLFSTLVSDKMVMDNVFFNTMMVQLLICGPDDAAIAPYFRLVFDNIYTRIYEVL